jgi:hypothetical protein
MIEQPLMADSTPPGRLTPDRLELTPKLPVASDSSPAEAS